MHEPAERLEVVVGEGTPQPIRWVRTLGGPDEIVVRPPANGWVQPVDTAIVDNSAPSGTAGGLIVATFGAPVLVTLQNGQVTGNVSYGCQVEGDPAVGVLTSLGGNTFSDVSCNPIGSDSIVP